MKTQQLKPVGHNEHSSKRQVKIIKCLHKKNREIKYQQFNSIPERSRTKKN